MSRCYSVVPGVSMLVLACLLTPARGAVAEAATNAVEQSASVAGQAAAQEAARAYAQLQEQFQAALRSIEKSREEAEQAARQSAETMAARLAEIQQSLNLQREKELESLRATNKAVLTLAVVFAAFGFLAVLFTSYYQNRTLNRLGAMTGGLPPNALRHASLATLALNESGSYPSFAVQQSNARLLGSIERLEKRLNELETGAALPAAGGSPTVTADNGDGGPVQVEPNTTGSRGEGTHPAITPGDRSTLVMGKGQALLNLGQADKALECFDEVLSLEPSNTDALVKKGAALEQLRRIPEAIESYDRALAVDGSLAMAHLCKGGLFNRLQRYDEALQCYEKALAAQRKSAAA